MRESHVQGKSAIIYKLCHKITQVRFIICRIVDVKHVMKCSVRASAVSL